MIERVAKTIRQFNMIEEGDNIVVGVSGGADSVCLFLSLLEYQKYVSFKLKVVHINHMIRPEASKDADFVRELCDKYDIPFVLHEIDVEKISSENHISTEEAGRLARYDAFNAEKPDKIAVGHHEDDVAETVLHNMCRGTGIHGMSGIAPISGKIIRPLLYVSRIEIEEYLSSIKQPYCVDKTNEGNDYTRNKIRNVILPYMKSEINAASSNHIAKLAGDILDIEDFLMTETEKHFEKLAICSPSSVQIDIQGLLQIPEILKREIILKSFDYLHVGRKDITRNHVQEVLSLIVLNGEKALDLPYGIKAIKSYDSIRIFVCHDKTRDTDHVTLPLLTPDGDEWIYTMADGSIFKARTFTRSKETEIPASDCTKWFDYDKIECSLMLRTREAGDYIVVDDLMHEKKLKDYMIDEKIPKSDRSVMSLLADGSHILWVIGRRISAYYKVSENTKTILEVDITDSVK